MSKFKAWRKEYISFLNVLKNKGTQNLFKMSIDDVDIPMPFPEYSVEAERRLFESVSSLNPFSSKDWNFFEACKKLFGVFNNPEELYADFVMKNSEYLNDEDLALWVKKVREWSDKFRDIYSEIELTPTFLGTQLFTVLKELSTELENLHTPFKNLNYLSSNRGTKENYLTRSSNNEIDSIVHDFIKGEYLDSSKAQEFLKESISILELDIDDFSIRKSEDVISFLNFETEGHELMAGEVGFGLSQLVPILLKIILAGDGSLIVEEPEANLHPNLQSKLADIFVLAHKTFGTQFILETHSEYMIRRFQYLIANKEFGRDDLIIHYFNSDKAVEKGEDKIKHIKVTQWGGLSDTFGPGFFDESTRLQFDLLQLKRNQLN